MRRSEIIAVGLAFCFVCFALGYFFGGSGEAEAYTVETAYSAGDEVYVGGDFAADAAAKAVEIAGETGGESGGGLVNINTADAAELQTLPGIGEILASRIIAYRETNGQFEDIIEITGVSGIGEGIFDGICDFISVD